MASYALIGGDGVTAWVAAIVAGTFGATLALVVDRAGCYSLDAGNPGGAQKVALYAVRVTLVLLIGTISAEFLIRRAFEHEGGGIALNQREQNDLVRTKSLREQFRVEELRAEGEKAEVAASRVATAMSVVPLDIQAQDAQAKMCWRSHASRRAALIAKGVSETAARGRLGTMLTRCASLTRAAKQALGSHLEQVKLALADAKCPSGNRLSRWSHL